jgi:tRNA (guanine-N7-)-methyltransferase
MARERTTLQNVHDVLIIPASEVKSGLNLSARFPAVRPLYVDVGCGRGRFLLAQARNHPDTNFLGIDRVSRRLHKIDHRACQAGLTNIRLIQGSASEIIREILEPRSVSVFFIFFPDPWPKRRHQCHRLVSPDFMAGLHAALVETGDVHICTDHEDYFLAISKLFASDSRFSGIPPFVPCAEEETDFEILFRSLGRSARRCSFRKQRLPITSESEDRALHS